jgi:hypothetical protein
MDDERLDEVRVYLLGLRLFCEREGWSEIRYKSGPDQANPYVFRPGGDGR